MSYLIVNELLQPDSVSQDSPTLNFSQVVPPQCIQHDAETQVCINPEKKNARVQIEVRTKTTGIAMIFHIIFVLLHKLVNFLGIQVCPGVRSVGIQCCIDSEETHQKGVNKGIQCSLAASVPNFQDTLEESESELSQCSYDQPSDHDTSTYTLQDESSS